MEAGTLEVLSGTTRLEALRATALLDSPREEAFDRLTRLATRTLGVPVALVTLVDEDRQFFKSCIGLPEPWNSERGTPLSHSFCQHAVASAEPLIIEDARRHPLVCENLAIADLKVIAYAGFPLKTAGGEVIGTFCAIDSEPRRWSDDDVEFVREMAAQAMTEIELRTTVRLLEDARAEAEGTAATLRELQAISDAALGSLALDDLLRELLARVAEAMEVPVAAVLLAERSGLEVRAARGLDRADEAAAIAFGEAVMAREEVSSGEGLLGVALVVGGTPIGALVVGAREPSDDEVRLLELAAERAAFAINNARLYSQALADADVLERRLVASLQRAQEEAAAAATERGRLLRHVVEAQEEERRRIALDIHDDYLQSLTAVRMQLERLGSSDERVVPLASEVSRTVDRMRGLVFGLRPPALDWAGVASALRLYLEETERQWGLAFRLASELAEEPAVEVRTVAFRIAQEAITNVRKHAEASVVEVRLAPRDGGLLVTVRDDGRGFEGGDDSPRSFGLAGMRERAEMAGGWWRVSSAPGEGTVVEFWLPGGG